MRVSEHFTLGRNQPTLDFVDVDTVADVPLFLDPRALRLLRSSWGHECVALVQDFFRNVLRLLRADRRDEASGLLGILREPNETHLGLSHGASRGRALGRQSASAVATALAESRAVASGLLEDLEDTILMVEGIDKDIVSDMTTNIIRGPLIAYTQSMCDFYGIPLTEGVDSGPLWDPATSAWFVRHERLPIADGRRILLMPKAIVRKIPEFEHRDYFFNFILPYLQSVELDAAGELVQLLRDGRSRVTKRDLIKKYGSGKPSAVALTERHPELLREYRAVKAARPQSPLNLETMAELTNTPVPDWDALLGAVTSLPPGNATADAYHNAIEALLSALFYPSLAMPQKEFPIHEGRKRVDIRYVNLAQDGFFDWLAKHHASATVFVECKNYSGDPANPELDQLAGRFSPSRGVVGLLLCRTFQDRDLFIRRCRDTASDSRGFIIPLDDQDLAELVSVRRTGDSQALRAQLMRRFERLTM